MNYRILRLALAALSFTGVLRAQSPPNLINYQGRVVVSGANFNGTGQFKFALIDGGVDQNTRANAFTQGVNNGQITFIQVVFGGSGYVTPPAVTITDGLLTGGGSGATAQAQIANGAVVSIQVTNGGSGYSGGANVRIDPPPPNLLYTTYWRNDRNFAPFNPGPPAVSVPLNVTNGLYSVLLGDFSLNQIDPFNVVTPPPPLVMTDIPTDVFTHSDVRLRVWFDDGVHGSQLLSPDQRLAPTAYHAAGSITSDAIRSGAINTGHIAPGAIHGTRIEAGSLDFSRFAAGAPSTGQVLAFNGTGLTWSTPSAGIWTVNGTNDAYYNGGKVGIGTANPDGKLDVRGRIVIENGGNAEVFTGTGNAELNRYLTLLNSTTSPNASGLKAGGVLVSDSYLYANPGKSDLIVKGNVGIGTATPATKLDVSGDIKVRVYSSEAIPRLRQTQQCFATSPPSRLLCLTTQRETAP